MKRRKSVLSLKSKDKLKVIERDIKPYLRQHHPKLMKANEQFNILLEALHYTIAHEVPEFYMPFMQFLLKNSDLERVKGTKRGGWNGDTDFIRNGPGSIVVPHKDHPKLALSTRRIGYLDGPYCVIKLLSDGPSQILCSMGKKTKNCCWDRTARKVQKIWWT